METEIKEKRSIDLVQGAAAAAQGQSIECYAHGGWEFLAAHGVPAGAAFDEDDEFVVVVLYMVGRGAGPLIREGLRRGELVACLSVVRHKDDAVSGVDLKVPSRLVAHGPEAYAVETFLAKVDYANDEEAALAIDKCPTKCIRDFSSGYPAGSSFAPPRDDAA